MMPAERAAKIICCLGMRSASSVGSMPVSSAKSSPPMSMAAVRSTAAAISGMRKNAAGVSTMVMKRVWPGLRPRFASSFATISSSRRRCAASSTFGTWMAFTSGPIAAPRSRGATPEVRVSFLFSLGSPAAFAHDSGGDELRIRGFVDADFGEQRAVVLAQLRCRRADRAGCARETRRHVVHGKGSHVGVGIIGDELALGHVRILEDLRDVVDRPDGDFEFFEEPDVLGLRALRDESADDGVQLVGVAQALRVGRIAGMVYLLRPAAAAGQGA